MAYLSLQHIHKNFASNTVLHNISLELEQGAFTCILGPSGCGKSTLLQIIAGLVQADSGQIFLQGQDISHVRAEKRHMGMVFQQYALFPHLNVVQNIEYGLCSPSFSKRERKHRVDEMLDLVALREKAQAYPHELSGGQQQRVALARAIAPRPKVLLLDEPLSALDAQVREQLQNELLRLQRETAITSLMVTHDQEEALALADYLIVMRNGVIEQEGTAEEIYTHSKNAFTATFLGHSNILSLKQIADGKSFGIRYEDVLVSEITERNLAEPYTFTAKVTHRALMGSYYRFALLLNDFQTTIYADLARSLCGKELLEAKFLAVHLPKEAWKVWEHE